MRGDEGRGYFLNLDVCNFCQGRSFFQEFQKFLHVFFFAFCIALYGAVGKVPDSAFNMKLVCHGYRKLAETYTLNPAMNPDSSPHDFHVPDFPAAFFIVNLVCKNKLRNMKKFLLLLFAVTFWISCKSYGEIPSPGKGSYENPVRFSSRDEAIQCLKAFETEYGFKIYYVDSVSGVDFTLLDKFAFPWKQLKKKQRYRDEVFRDHDVYYFYINTNAKENECSFRKLEEILYIPER